MADEGPPKPKPGSLKDRIKQFEVSSSSSSNSPAPPPLRPKPGTLGQWKPKPLDPPSANKQATFSTSSQETTQASEDHAQGSGMSATDAISSISKGGGSLKERMAALQGKGAFGDTSTSSAPPLPSSEGKPRVWRASPAPPIEPKKTEEGTEIGDEAEDIGYERSPIEPSPISPADDSKRTETAGEVTGEGHAEEANEEEPKTEEEQERERRAAIAARMARLGGARVGMPVGFGIAAKGLHGGSKPNIPVKPRILTPGGAGSAGSSAPSSALSPAPTSALSPVPTSSIDKTDKAETERKNTLDTALKVPLPKSQGSLLTPGTTDDADVPSESDATTSGKLVPPRSPAIPKSPDSMPIPALPKRVAGPRRKKSTREIKPESTSTEETKPPAVPISDPAPLVNEPQVVTPTQQEGASVPGPDDAKHAMKKEPYEADQTPVSLTEEPVSALDDIASVAPSEATTPPPPSPSVLATEDEDAESIGDRPSRRPTVEVPVHEPRIVEEDGADLLTPHPRSNSREEMGGTSLSAPVATVHTGPEPTKEKATGYVADEAKWEEEEAARKKRVAEKMARMGAVNPFPPGGFAAPVSPQNDKQGQADAVKAEDISEKQSEEESGEAAVTKKTTDNDSDVDLAAAHESEPNVHVLSQSQTPLSAAAVIQDEESDRNAGVGVLAEEEEAVGDVEYPMMSPVASGQSDSYTTFALPLSSGEPVSREAPAAVEANSQYDDEKESSEDDDEGAETETIHDHGKTGEDGAHPKHITRAVPPPPPGAADSSYLIGVDSSLSAETSSPTSAHFSPTSYDLEDSSPRAALAAALSRRAPIPPPGNQPSMSPQVQDRSISPTPSPPPRPFVREGAPSPPSPRSLSSEEGEEEEYYDDEEGYPADVSHEQEEAEGTPTEERAPSPVIEEQIKPPSPPPVVKASPPPLPGGRPPIPSARRSIPPPPRHALPPPPTMAAAAARPPAPIPKQSIMMIPSSPSIENDEEADYGATPVTMENEATREIRQATARPALPPPRGGLAPEHALRPSHNLPSEKEIMDDEEGDPVDPYFVGTRSSPHEGGMAAARTRKADVRQEEEQSSEAADLELDVEAARRRTIAERMAKLGGIKFGVPVTARPPAVRKVSDPDGEHTDAGGKSGLDTEVDNDQAPEEVERSRRAGIAARMAAMGGRGLGMYGGGAVPSTVPVASAKTPSPPPIARPPSAPLASPPPLPGSRPKRHSRDDVKHAIARPPPPAPTTDMISSTGGGETSESEVEMVTAEIEEEGEMVEEVEDEEPELVDTPPVPPNRSGRPPVPHASRPPLPPPSSEATGPPLPSGRRAHPPAPPTNDYEVVDDESRAAPPMSRASHSRPVPAPNAQPASTPSMDSSGQWELPNIPSGSFDLGNYGKGARQSRSAAPPENDASWTKVEQEESSTHGKASIFVQTTLEPFSGPPPLPISAEALVGLAHRLGPTIVSSAQHIHERSKRLVIGDGSSTSFLHMVLSPIGGVSTSSFGHLVYVQTGSAVQKRLGDIMPGDVIALYEARFKGHKGGLGLGAYSVSWGAKEEPVLGVVSDFEGKKNKVKAFAVSQHPNSYPTIDTPSYKLDDLKGGTLKVFRVAESL